MEARHCSEFFCVVFCGTQRINMSFKSCLRLMILFTASCLQCPLVRLWRVAWWNSPYVSSPSYLSVASSPRRSSSYAASTWFDICMKLFLLVCISPFAFFIFAWGAGGAPRSDVFCFNIFTLSFFVLSLFVLLVCVLLLCCSCYFCFIAFIEYLMKWSFRWIFLVSSKVCSLVISWSWCISAVVYKSISNHASSIAAVASFSV